MFTVEECKAKEQRSGENIKNCQKQTQRDDRCTFRGCIDGIPMAETSVFWFWQANYGYGGFHLDFFSFIF